MGTALLTPASVAAPLRSCGYRPDLLRTDFLLANGPTIPLVGFAQSPADSRSACVAVLSETGAPLSAVEACRPLGAPLVFVCFQDTLQWWKQGAQSAEYRGSVPADNVERFFRDNLREFKPDAVYRAKTWGRFRPEFQLSFVDLGLLPLVEEQVGKSLAKLVERNVTGLKRSMGWREVTEDEGHWLIETVFWLVSGKILRDKQVQGFADLNLNDIEDVFRRLGRHYGTAPLAISSNKRLEGLRESARIINQFASLALTTTESLAYVYENALISKETRSAFNTHRTPSFLVDYVVGNLTDWIEDIPLNDRSVFEPACGHSAFLVAAMRLLTDMLPPEKAVPSRRGPYLRSRMHGVDVDAFAVELGRLSLTLTDIPNPNGWDLQSEDMFLGDNLTARAKKTTILLANPPFDNFTPQEQKQYLDQRAGVHFSNKTAEMLWRTLPHMPEGGVFGVVLPQTLLHSAQTNDLRKFLSTKCELREICLFPDKVFAFADAESAVLIGRRKMPDKHREVRYRRVRENHLDRFRSDYSPSSTQILGQSRFSLDSSFSFRLPELEEIWNACAENPILKDIASVGQGLTYRTGLKPSSITYSDEEFEGGRRGFIRFTRSLELHQLPKEYWLNLDPSVIWYPRSGSAVGCPQVLLNYAPADRGPWRLKALVDRRGHPVTSRFITVRPQNSAYSIETLWAILNSPIANAYAFSHLGKRDNTVGVIRKLPVPKVRSFDKVERAATAYLAAASGQTAPTTLQRLLLQVDVEVLNLYSLPPSLERQLLEIFDSEKRVGVPFKQTAYLPRELEGKILFSDFLQFEADWRGTNRERGILIDKNISGTLKEEELARLKTLQAYADYHIERVAPRSTRTLDELENRIFSSSQRKQKNGL